VNLNQHTARVIANFGASLAVAPLGVDTAGEKLAQAVPLKKLPLLVAGDTVVIEEDDHGSLRVVELIDRESVLERIDGRRGMKAMAANVTHLAIVSAAPPGIDSLLIDQFCLAAHKAAVDAIIIVNKADLLSADELSEAKAMLAVYAEMGYDTALVSTKADGGMEALDKVLENRAVTFVGASGVGKSSIIGALLPDLEVRTGAISAATGQGSHTTTVTCWYDMDINGQGGALIDSPGVRQYSVAHLEPVDVRLGYRDIQDAGERCRFADCSHRVEPECEVQSRVTAGDIAQWRFDNYCKLLDEEPV